MKAWWVALALIRQNRWLLVLFCLFPLAVSGALLAFGGLEQDDALMLLHQGCWYGLGIAAFQPSSLLRSEQRSRRIVQVLACPVSRGEYLAAVLLAVWLPLVPYAGALLFSGELLGISVSSVLPLVVDLLATSAWVGMLALLLSLRILPLLASALALGAVQGWMQLRLPPGGLFRPLLSLSDIPRIDGTNLLSLVAETLIFYLLARYLFLRQDLDLTQE